jgi:hypothetical protein
MRGRFHTWTRIRVNLQHVPEDLRPSQEALDPNEEPGGWSAEERAAWDSRGSHRRNQYDSQQASDGDAPAATTERPNAADEGRTLKPRRRLSRARKES